MPSKICMNPFGRHTKRYWKSVKAISPNLHSDILLAFPTLQVPPRLPLCLNCKFYARREAKAIKETKEYKLKNKDLFHSDVQPTNGLRSGKKSTENVSTTAAVEEDDDNEEGAAGSEHNFDEDLDENDSHGSEHPTCANVRVVLTREPEVESAVQEAMRRRRSAQRLKSSSATLETTSKCFICGAQDVLFKKLGCNQATVFKSMIMKPLFKNTISAALCKEIKDKNRLDCCAECFLDIKKISDIKEQIRQLQKEIEEVIEKARTKIQLRNVKEEETSDIEGGAAELESAGDNTEEGAMGDCDMDHFTVDFDEDVKPFDVPVFEDVLNALDKDDGEAVVTIDDDENPALRPAARASKLKATENLRQSLAYDYTMHSADSEGMSDSASESDGGGWDSDEDYVEGTGPFICPECGKEFPTRTHCTQHIYRTHSQKEKRFYVCEECGQQCNSQPRLAFHKDTVHNPDAETFSCEKCGRKFYEKKKLYIHKVVTVSCHSPVDQKELDLYKVKFFPCEAEKCDRKFRSAADLARHKGVHEEERDRPFHCLKCMKSFTTKYRLIFHEKTVCGAEIDVELKKKLNERGRKAYAVMKTYPWKCSKCPGRFATQDSLQKHQETTCVSLKPPRRWICHLCGKSYCGKESMLSHIKRIHNQEKNVSCRYCERKFFDEVSCKKHIQNIHEKDTNSPPVRVKNQECNICQRKFCTRWLLQLHKQRVHLNIKRFKCEVCEKMFFDRRNMKRHMTTHQNKDQD